MPQPPPETIVSALVAIDGPGVIATLRGRGDAGNTAIRALESRILRRQQPVVDAARRLGIVVISRYTTAANGLLVHATGRQLAALASVPGVAFIEPAPIVRPMLAQSVPWVGATRLARERGFDGKDSIVAVIDTGVDYTHGMLGGPGTVDAWQAANRPGATEVITDTFEGKRLFPNAKVIGGYDFVGPRYNPPHICTPARHAAGECTNIPVPDDDPLDGAGHGTHVSGIVAGAGLPAIGDGMAPGAGIVGLKLYGTGGADEAADVLVDAIEWCARVNLKLESRGVVPPRVDAINISLGEAWAQGSRLFDAAVEAATDAGVVVVASAGNAGNTPFILGAPSASPKLVSVASSLPPALTLDVAFRWEGGEATHPGVESTIGKALDAAGRVEAELAWFGRGCNVDAPVQDVREKVALVARGECIFPEKMLNAQAAGAVAVVMFSTATQGKNGMSGSSAGITIPGVMIDNAPGLDLVAKLEAGTTVTAIVDPAGRRLDFANANAIAGYSSRGPSKNGALKPDITAPGSAINSAAMGSGSRGVAMGGTSMASPHVAGAAGLLQHRNRAEKLGLPAADIAALLMNYARPVVFDAGGDRPMVPVVRQGAGVIDLWQSGNANLVVRAGDLASLNLGAPALAQPRRITRMLTARNIGSTPMRVKVDARFAYPEDEDAGVAVEPPADAVAIAAGATMQIPVTFVIDPAALRPWTLWPGATADGGAINQLEVDGYVTLTSVDAQGQPLADVPVASVPFYTLPRQASELAAEPLPPALEDDVNVLTIRNASPFAGQVELFSAPAIVDGDIGRFGPAEDPDEPDVAHELDIRAVGARFDPPAVDGGTSRLTFGLARHEAAAIPLVTSFEIYLDTDRNGTIDHRIRESAAGSRMRTGYAAWDAETGAIRGTEAFTDTTHATDLHTRITLLSVPMAAIGLDEPNAFDFYVIGRGLNEDWLFTPNTDVAPDGADAAGGPRYRFDPGMLARVPETMSAPVPGGGRASIGLRRGPGEIDGAWLALYPNDAPERPQMAFIVPGARDSGRVIFLPGAFWESEDGG